MKMKESVGEQLYFITNLCTHLYFKFYLCLFLVNEPFLFPVWFIKQTQVFTNISNK